jgi:hypothetical protein
MTLDELKVIVAGDVTVDWYFWTRPPESNEDVNWKLYEGMNISPQPGGAILLAKMLINSLNQFVEEGKVKIIFQKCNESELRKMDSNQILHTNVKLGIFPAKKSSKAGSSEDESNSKVYRVKKSYGYTTPNKENLCPDPLDIDPNKEFTSQDNAQFVIIHDVGNGFRSVKDGDGNGAEKWSEKWPTALKKDHKPVIIYHMYPPLFKGDLWEHVLKYHKNNLILILNADDLRKLGANISRSISWEKTALDCLWEIKHNPGLVQINDLPNVIVRFKNEGAIYYNGQSKRIGTKLYFNPSYVEGGSWNEKKLGTMRGTSLVFVSTVASELISNFINKQADIADILQKENVDVTTCEQIDINLMQGIKKGLMSSLKFIKNGHGKNEKEGPIFFEEICKTLFIDDKKDKKIKNEDYIVCTKVPKDDGTKPDLNPWSILGSRKKDMKLEGLAINIVKKGTSEIKEIPKGCFGKLTTVDRAEIESFRSIMKIMEEYISSDKIARPLSIAAFGYPGSGKSFGVTEVARSIDQEKVFKIDFNVSQFTSIKDLTSAFYRIRDISLEGKIPLVFFDEFDCKYGDQTLGWLKYFLVPMQDGKFLDNGNLHPIGKSIFVFAGGVYKTYSDFCAKMGIKLSSQAKFSEKETSTNEGNIPEKCPDFVSRLRGYVNILGPNEIDDEDEVYIIRRAIQLRSLIEEKIPYIIKTSNNNINGKSKVAEVNIDEDILRALIKIPRYIHGVRSMEAIIDMSMFKGEDSWQKSSLPSKDQLQLHVDGTKFYKILAENRED